jgi:hypothetical protein
VDYFDKPSYRCGHITRKEGLLAAIGNGSVVVAVVHGQGFRNGQNTVGRTPFQIIYLMVGASDSVAKTWFLIGLTPMSYD